MTKKNVRTRAEAKKLMWEYYRDNKASLPKWIGEYREELLSKIQGGSDGETTFLTVIDSIESKST